jgi:hypothetical protein
MQSIAFLVAGGAFVAVLMAWRIAQLVKLHRGRPGFDRVRLHRLRSGQIQAISGRRRS